MNKGNFYKKIGKSTWLPFWFGNKFNKRLMQKRVRKEKKNDR
jgi:hypothetical protein